MKQINLTSVNVTLFADASKANIDMNGRPRYWCLITYTFFFLSASPVQFCGELPHILFNPLLKGLWYKVLDTNIWKEFKVHYLFYT